MLLQNTTFVANKFEKTALIGTSQFMYSYLNLFLKCFHSTDANLSMLL